MLFFFFFPKLYIFIGVKGEGGLIAGWGRSSGEENGSCVLAWEIPCTEEPDGLQSVESQESRQDTRLSDSFSRQEYWSGKSFPSPEDLPNPGIEPGSSALQADSLLPEPSAKPFIGSSKILLCISLEANQDPAPRLYCCSLTVPPLSLHPLPSLISICFNLFFGTQGRLWRLNVAYFL